jgi:hypothetical protein
VKSDAKFEAGKGRRWPDELLARWQDSEWVEVDD